MSTELLWISQYPPISTASDAGSNTYNYYFRSIAGSGSFSIRLLSCALYAQKNVLETELDKYKYAIVYWGDPNENKLFKLQNIESRFNPWNKYCNMLSNTTVSKLLVILKQWRDEGYKPDTVILEWTPIVLLSHKIRDLFPNAKIIASEHDVTFIGYERKSKYYRGLQGASWKLRYSREKKKEIDALKCCDLILPHNASNVDILIQQGIERKKIQWLVPFFQNMSDCKREPNGRDILFFGAMSRPENYLSAIWFIEKVMPLLDSLDVRFVILGNKPPAELSKYESERLLITGFVDTIVPYFEQSVCFVAPLVLGAGIKVKILEAMSSGIPVLTNEIGIEGIQAKPGTEYLHCGEPEEYADAIKKILGDTSFGEKIGSDGQKFINTEFSFQRSANDYLNRIVEMQYPNKE